MQEQIQQAVIDEAQRFYEGVNWQNVIDRMAEGLGTTGEYLWTVLVQGTIVDGVAGLILTSSCVLVFLILGICGYKNLKSLPWSEHHWNEQGWCRFWFTGIIPMIVGMIVILVVTSDLQEDIMKVGAPEYEALRFLISQAK
jgi:hypothetical protein